MQVLGSSRGSNGKQLPETAGGTVKLHARHGSAMVELPWHIGSEWLVIALQANQYVTQFAANNITRM